VVIDMNFHGAPERRALTIPTREVGAGPSFALNRLATVWTC